MEGKKINIIGKNYTLLITAGVAIFFIIIAVLFTTPAKAVTISQLNLELNARPGETIEQVVQLYDDSFAGVTVYPVVYNFTADPSKEGAVLILTDPEDLKPDRDWVKWSPSQVLGEDTDIEGDVPVDAGGVEQVIPEDLGQENIPIALPVEGTLADFPYWIEIPQDAEPGTHLISLVFQIKPAEQTNTEGAAVYIGSNVATNIFLKVLGATIDDIEVDFKSGVFTNREENISATERKESFILKNFFLKPPVDFLVTVSNQGNTHQKPDGNIKIINDLFGSQPEQILVNQENKIVLPGTERTFGVSSFGQGFMFGKYRAKIMLLYGNPLRPVEKEISFWIIPLVEILIALGIIILIIVIIIVIRKTGKKKREGREKEKEEKMRQQIVDELKGNKQPPQGFTAENLKPEKKKSGNGNGRNGNKKAKAKQKK